MIPDVQSHFETPKKIGPNPQKSYDFLITLVTIMFLSGGYAVWFISTYLYAYDDTEYAYIPSTRRASASQIATSTDMTNWQTYRNEEYGFEFKYPDNWSYATSGATLGLFKLRLNQNTKMQELSDSDGTDLPDSVTIEVFKGTFSDKKSLVTFVDDLKHYSINKGSISEEQNGSFYGFKTLAGPDSFGGGSFYFTSNNKNSFVFWTFESGTDFYSEIDTQIFSTFKFIP
jgi:hypothetical protein